MNFKSPKCCICGNQVSWENRITVKVTEWFKRDIDNTESVAEHQLYRLSFHKKCYERIKLGVELQSLEVRKESEEK